MRKAMCSRPGPHGSRNTPQASSTISMAFRAGASKPTVRSKMSMYRFALLIPAAAVGLLAQQPNLGRQLTPAEIQKLDITIGPDGSGLPPGSGTVSAGAMI